MDRSVAPTVVDQSESSIFVRADPSQPIINLRFDEPFEVLANRVHRLSAVVSVSQRLVHSKSKLSGRGQQDLADLHFFYGINASLAARVRTKDGQKDVIFSFDNESEDSETKTQSLPATPQPPPRPPPPKEYRSRMARLKRALSFSEKRVEGEEVAAGQIPVIMFFA